MEMRIEDEEIARSDSAVTETILLDEIEQNQAILFKLYTVHHLILTCLFNCCIIN